MTLTPMMQQYFELKNKVQDSILFFRMGDFYEIFDKDAELVAPILGIVLTSRDKGDEVKVPFCGVPHHSAKNYWSKLIKMGFKVAIADQLEDPATAKGLVKRDIVKILTPGNIDDIELLDQNSPNYTLAIYEEPEKKVLSICLFDVSTGEIRLGNLINKEEIKSFCYKYRPKEILARKFFHAELIKLLEDYLNTQKILIEPLPESILRDFHQQQKELKDVFGSSSLDQYPCGSIIGGQALIAAIIVYLKSLHTKTDQFLTIKSLQDPNTMVLDETVQRDLELFESISGHNIKGSLFAQINHTASAMGARLLRRWLAHPLLDKHEIMERHCAIDIFLKSNSLKLENIKENLKGCPDLERLLTRIVNGYATPTELAQVRESLFKAQWLVNNISLCENIHNSKLLTDCLNNLKHYYEPLSVLCEALQEAPTFLGEACKVFKIGYDNTLDKLNQLAQNGQQLIKEYEEHLRQQTGINSLKIKHHSSLGFLIEVTKPNLSKVPQDFIRKQTMINAERFVTLRLVELNDSLANALEQAILREKFLYSQLLQHLFKFKKELKLVAEALSTIDALISLSWVAKKRFFNKAQISEDGSLELKASRHPVVEAYIGFHKFVPNDITITPPTKTLLITGPNMAGKSTFMRQIALCAILNQMGSFVPAVSAKLPIFDRIFTRIGASDDLAQGKSTFMLEMLETANIIRNATQNSLVLLDEVGRGTSTQDGLSIALAVLEDITCNIKSYVLFSTHYHELVKLAKNMFLVKFITTDVIEQNGKIIFTHKIIDGSCANSFGIEVAKLAGIPQRVIDKAQKYLQTTIQESSIRINLTPKTDHSKNSDTDTDTNINSSIFNKEGLIDTHDITDTHYYYRTILTKNSIHYEKPQSYVGELDIDPEKIYEILKKISTVKIYKITPLQALNLLDELQTLLNTTRQRKFFDI